ncbi:hypothetical protein ACMV5I_06595 [Serratia sp. T13T92]|uniref:hypothetical protein n=1 Tax=Serratia sp. T13T92 TaxID=3397496 RepID=UPI0039E0A809
MLVKKIDAGNEFFELFNYKLCCFLNTRNKARRWKEFSYVEWDEGVFDLNLIVNKTKIDLIRWFDSLSDIEERRLLLLRNKFTGNDFECIKTVLSRFGYLFGINKKPSDKDYRLLFFVLQLINMKSNRNTGLNHNELMTSLCQQFLCELFMCYEDFSRFRVCDDGLLFETENIGSVNLFDVLNLIFLDKGTGNSCKIGGFYISLIKFLFINDNKKYHLNFDDKNEKFIYPDFFINYANDEKKVNKLFSLIKDMFNPLQSTNEVFVSNLLLMNYIFYLLKDNPSYLLKIKSFLRDDYIFFRFFEAIIKRGLIVGKHHFTDLGLDDYLRKIQLNETQFYNILHEI